VLNSFSTVPFPMVWLGYVSASAVELQDGL
jgi:hypothetical protein